MMRWFALVLALALCGCRCECDCGKVKPTPAPTPVVPEPIVPVPDPGPLPGPVEPVRPVATPLERVWEKSATNYLNGLADFYEFKAGEDPAEYVRETARIRIESFHDASVMFDQLARPDGTVDPVAARAACKEVARGIRGAIK